MTTQYEIYPVDFTPITDENIQHSSYESIPTDKSISHKKKKRMQNFTKIKLLKSVHDNNSDIVDGGGIDDDDAKNTLEETSVKEGIENIINISDFNVADEIKIPTDFNVPHIIVNFFRSLKNKINDIEYNTAYAITKTLSFNDFMENDVEIMKKYTTWFFVNIVCCFTVYSWFYVMVYKDEFTEAKMITLASRINRRELHTASVKFSLLRLIEPYLTLAFFFPEYIYKITAEWIPDFMEKIFNPSFIFVFIFYLSIYLLYNFSDFIFKIIIDMLNLNISNPMVLMVYVAVIAVFFHEWVRFSKNPIEQLASRVPFVQVMYYLCYFIYFVICLFVTPIVAIVLSVFVLGFVSFFSMGFSVPIKIREINEFIKKKSLKINTETFCEPTTFWEKFISTFKSILEFIYKYVFHSAFVIMVLYSLNDFTHNIESDTLKVFLAIINLLTLMVISTIIFVDLTSDNENNSEYFVGT